MVFTFRRPQRAHVKFMMSGVKREIHNEFLVLKLTVTFISK